MRWGCAGFFPRLPCVRDRFGISVHGAATACPCAPVFLSCDETGEPLAARRCRGGELHQQQLGAAAASSVEGAAGWGLSRSCCRRCSP